MKKSQHQKINPHFPNTTVPLACLFIHLEHGYTTDQFLQDFPEVGKEQVEQALELAIEIFKQPEMLDGFEGMVEERINFRYALSKIISTGYNGNPSHNFH